MSLQPSTSEGSNEAPALGGAPRSSCGDAELRRHLARALRKARGRRHDAIRVRNFYRIATYCTEIGVLFELLKDFQRTKRKGNLTINERRVSGGPQRTANED